MHVPVGKRKVRSRVVILISLVATMGLFTVGVAQAAVTTHVSAAYNTSTSHFHGKVASGNAECVAHRTVRLYKKTNSGRVLQGKTTSGSKGGWSIDVMNAHGKYVAVVPAQTEMSTSCGGATSSVVDVM